MIRLLLIDDDATLTTLLAEYLQKDGFHLSVVNDGIAGLRRCQQQQFDLIILDVMMPLLDGITVLKQLRQFSQTPVIMLTARGEELDKVLGLELGADDYMAKPCLPRELSARIKAILRRSRQQLQHNVLTSGDLSVQTASRQVMCGQREIVLTGTEFNILYLLVSCSGSLLSKAEISQQALGRSLGAYDRSIDVHISHIRQKLGPHPQGLQWITAVRGKGYQFNIQHPANRG